MRIAVNTRLLLKDRLEGIGWFTYETLKRIVKAHPQVEFIFLFDREPDPSFLFGKNVKALVAHPQARHPVLWWLFFEIGIYRRLKQLKPDLFLSPDGWLSLRSKVPSLAVIHDLNFEAHPEFLPKHIAAYYHYFFPKFAAKAKRIATVSEYTKADIATRYKVPAARIDVVYNGCNAEFQTLDVGRRNAVKAKYSDGCDYFLFVGLIHPRKNLEHQLEAFSFFKRETGSNMKFLVVGARHWYSDGLARLEKESAYAKDIIFLGRQPMDVLYELYGAAFALLYVSYFEGFGIPILEAFHAGIPVITSNRSSMPEICLDAGIAVDPDDTEAIAKAMMELHLNPGLRESLIAKGHERKTAFSWELTAQALWHSIEKAVR